MSRHLIKQHCLHCNRNFYLLHVTVILSAQAVTPSLGNDSSLPYETLLSLPPVILNISCLNTAGKKLPLKQIRPGIELTVPHCAGDCYLSPPTCNRRGAHIVNIVLSQTVLNRPVTLHSTLTCKYTNLQSFF